MYSRVLAEMNLRLGLCAFANRFRSSRALSAAIFKLLASSAVALGRACDFFVFLMVFSAFSGSGTSTSGCLPGLMLLISAVSAATASCSGALAGIVSDSTVASESVSAAGCGALAGGGAATSGWLSRKGGGRWRVALFVAAAVLSDSALRAADKVEVEYKPDITYATVDEEQLQLDIAAPMRSGSMFNSLAWARK